MWLTTRWKATLYHNNHDGTFTNVALEQNVAYGTNAIRLRPWDPSSRTMTTTARWNLFVSDMRYHRLFRNSPKEGFFIDTTADAGIARVAGQYVGWATGSWISTMTAGKTCSSSMADCTGSSRWKILCFTITAMGRYGYFR